MSDMPDLGKIKPPEHPPADQPDQKTTDEALELRKKAPTPLEREAEAHRSHVESLQQRIAYHNGECEQLRAEVAVLRAELTGERQETKSLSVSCAVLQTSGCAVGCMTTAGTFLTIIGSVLLGVAGVASGLTDPQKMGLTGAGAALAVCGGLFVVASYAVSWWTKPKGHDGK
jgi:hypothetical protein